MQQTSYPFVARVNSSIRFVQQAPFKEGAEVTITNALRNGQFVYVRGQNLPLHIDRFDLTSDQLDLVRRRLGSS